MDDPARLSEATSEAMGDGDNDVDVSAAVAWEIVVKKGLGNLAVPDDLELRRSRTEPVTSPM